MEFKNRDYMACIGIIRIVLPDKKFNIDHMKNFKYFIILFCNKKKVRVLYKCMTKNMVYEHWHEFKTQKKPRFTKLQGGKRKKILKYELGLIFPNNKWSKPTYIKDDLGRNVEAKMMDEKFRIKELVPYWEEEKIYDFKSKKRIQYDEMLKIFLQVEDIAQIFTLNNKLFLQVEDDIRLFGNKNINDANRLLDVVKEDLIKQKKGNFIFIRDITTHQRSQLYDLLVSKGFKRNELIRQYSY